MSKSILPQNHWPNFLKLALAAGTAEEAPLSRSLNEAMSLLGLRAGDKVLPASPRLISEIRMREILDGLGFSTRELSRSALHRLFDAKDHLLENWGRPEALRELCEIYLGKATLLRGFDFRGARISRGEGRTLFRLGDRQAAQRQLLFRLQEKGVSDAQVAAFKLSARNMVPDSFKIEVKYPVAPTVIIRPILCRLGRHRMAQERIL